MANQYRLERACRSSLNDAMLMLGDLFYDLIILYKRKYTHPALALRTDKWINLVNLLNQSCPISYVLTVPDQSPALYTQTVRQGWRLQRFTHKKQRVTE